MSTRTLVSTITCPHCWHEFAPATVRFISEHAALRGDAVLGDAAQLRFLPSRFDAQGRAIDPLGAACTRLACPRCHLELPPAVIELPQTILSIVGAPACGKSVMLAAASFSMRSGLVVDGLEFLDADPTLNDLTVELESALFRSSTPDRPTMIAKTDLSGRLYRSFRFADASWTAPKPQLFVIGRGGARHLLALYDNAGEHFLPGADAPHEPVTRHLAVSRALVFVVDPTQDQRVIERLGGREAVQSMGGAGSLEQRQDLVLIEAANRVRRLRGLGANEPLPLRIVLALAKADIWGHLAEPQIRSAAERLPARPSIAVPSPEVLAEIDGASARFLAAHMPEFLATARALDPRLRVVPFSGLGSAPSRVAAAAALAIRPRDLRPMWPAAPLVVALSEAEPALFREFARA
ncbi:MAG: hypothetical protein GC172_06500 [Phycisphaera sp.]|nr:hypothetical protein [Phycisphaera sp.]